MAVYRTRVAAVAAKIEAVSGTDSVPTLALNSKRFLGTPVLTVDYLEPGKRDDVVHGGMGSIARAAPVGRFGTITLRMEARGAGSTYAAGAATPEVDEFLRAAGFLSTNTAATRVYTSLDDGFETMTLYCWSANKLFKLVGCVVHPHLTMDVNGIAIWEMAITGAMTADPTQTALGAITANNTIPPVFANSAISIGAVNYAAGLFVRRFDLDYPVTIAARSGAGAPDGLIGYAITARGARLAMDIEQTPLATFDPYALSKAAGAGGVSTAGSLQLGAAGSFNGIMVEWGQWAIERPTHNDVEGLATWSLEGDLVQYSGAVYARESRITYS
jgi:hypothetical protein